MPERGRCFENGFTFVELLVAVTIVAVVSVPLLSLFICGYATTVTAGRQTVAVNLCRDRIEEIKGGSCAWYNQFNGEESPIVLFEETPVPDFDLFCRRTEILSEELPGFPGITMARIIVTVSWRQGEVERSITLETYLDSSALSRSEGVGGYAGKAR